LIHPALGEPHASSIFQIYGRDDDHKKIPDEKEKLKNWLTNTNAIDLFLFPNPRFRNKFGMTDFFHAEMITVRVL
jgi:hypothetical protein